MKRTSILSACMLTLLAAGSAWASTLDPLWRGEEGSTFQEWTFSSDANPATPETSDNPYGTATADVTVGLFGSGWLDDLGFGTQYGYWDLGGEGQILLDIPNRPQALPYKEISIQVVYYTGPLAAPVVDVPGAQLVSTSAPVMVEPDVLGAWMLVQSTWRIEPNPSSEQISFTATNQGALIDRIVVDTICAPEPASVLMLGLASLLLRRRRA